MKMILLSTALSILYAPAWSCGNGECDPHPDEPGIETPEKPAEPEPQPEPEQPAPGPESPAPEPEKPAPSPEPDRPARPAPDRGEREAACGVWISGLPADCQHRPQPRPYSLAAISDQTYAPAKYTPMPQVCARTWWGGLRYSIPSGATKHGARDRCLRWLEGR